MPLLCSAAPSHKHPSIFRVRDFAKDGPVWRGHVWRSFCCFLLSCPAELQPPHRFSRQVPGGPLCSLATCGWAAAIPRGGRQAKAEASLHILSEFLSLLSSDLNPGSAVPTAVSFLAAGANPDVHGKPASDRPYWPTMSGSWIAHIYLTQEERQARMAVEAHPLLPSGSITDGWPSRSEEKQADLGQELQRQLLANWATASTASFLAFML